MHSFKLLLKVLARRKFFTLVNLFGISFTLMVLLVGTTLFENFLFPRGPEKRSDLMLVAQRLEMTNDDNTTTWTSDAGYYFLDRFVRPMKTPHKFAIMGNATTVMNYQSGAKVELAMRPADGNIWDILDYQFLAGGPFSEAQNQAAAQVAIVSRGTAETVFGTDQVLGKSLEINGLVYEVIGVVQNVSRLESRAYGEVWVPINSLKDQSFKDKIVDDFLGFFLAEKASDLPLIKDEYDEVIKNVVFPDPSFTVLRGGADNKIEMMARSVFGGYEKETQAGQLLGVILGLVLLFMTLPAINLMNLNTSRIMERSSEIGVRKAFGATTWDLMKQLLRENLLLTTLGGLVGLLLAVLVLSLIASSQIFPYFEWHLNFRVFLAGFFLVCVFGLYSGLYPAFNMSRLEVVSSLKRRAL
ncbi:MAG: ABC transporter permease [Acidobacteria bacterium]|nr:ABC transporter permease [Acidobacteriota bacterium]MCB9397926.1 ABC transporter permease [Acidobacteriota bacterium]